jgi:Tol biopolymer transport system component
MASGYGAPQDLWIMNSDGSNRRDLGICPGIDKCGKLAWAPDGRRIAWAQGTNLYVADLATGTPELVASGLKAVEPPYGEGGPGPTWSPDGRSLAFTCGDWLCVVDADGGHPRHVGPELTDPDWSPNRDFILGEYWSGSASSPSDLFLQRLGEVGQPRVTTASGYPGAWHPSWAPDGRAIVFYENQRVFRINPDGSGRKQLTSGPRDFTPDWGPSA